MIYYRKTLFGRGPKLTAVHSQNIGLLSKPRLKTSKLYVFMSDSTKINGTCTLILQAKLPSDQFGGVDSFKGFWVCRRQVIAQISCLFLECWIKRAALSR